MANWLDIFPVLLILAALAVLFIFPQRRHSVISLAVLYLGIFILLVQISPLPLAAAKLITGWMAAAILGLNLPQETYRYESGETSKKVFNVFSLLLIWILAFLVAKPISTSFQVRPEIAFAALAIFGSGLLRLGIKSEPFYVIVGILVVYSGFDLLYTSVESSVLINGLLAVITLLIAMIGSYFTGIGNREGQS